MDDQYCSVCGWLRPVARAEGTGMKERVFCPQCADSPKPPAQSVVRTPSNVPDNDRSVRFMKVLLVFVVLTILLHHGTLLLVASLGIEDHVSGWSWQWVAFPVLASIAFLSVAYLARWSFQ